MDLKSVRGTSAPVSKLSLEPSSSPRPSLSSLLLVAMEEAIFSCALRCLPNRCSTAWVSDLPSNFFERVQMRNAMTTSVTNIPAFTMSSSTSRTA